MSTKTQSKDVSKLPLLIPAEQDRKLVADTFKGICEKEGLYVIYFRQVEIFGHQYSGPAIKIKNPDLAFTLFKDRVTYLTLSDIPGQETSEDQGIYIIPIKDPIALP